MFQPSIGYGRELNQHYKKNKNSIYIFLPLSAREEDSVSFLLIQLCEPPHCKKEQSPCQLTGKGQESNAKSGERRMRMNRTPIQTCLTGMAKKQVVRCNGQYREQRHYSRAHSRQQQQKLEASLDDKKMVWHQSTVLELEGQVSISRLSGTLGKF